MPNVIVNRLKIVGPDEDIKNIISDIEWIRKEKCINKLPFTINFETTIAALPAIIEISKSYPALTFHLCSFDDIDFAYTVAEYEYLDEVLLGETNIIKNGEILVSFIPKVEYHKSREN